jgi:transcriptional regulatory protein RtcR
MATLAPGGRITTAIAEDEIARLRQSWAAPAASRDAGLVARFLSADRIAQLDRFDRTQLEDALAVCLEARSLSEAGRALFSASRTRRATANDADRLRKYLARFDLAWQDLHATRERD